MYFLLFIFVPNYYLNQTNLNSTMKRSFLILPLFALSIHFAFSQETRFDFTEWENPAIFKKGQTLPHAFHIPFTNAESALKNEKLNCSNFQLLNGKWKFKWVEKPELVPEGFQKSGFSTKSWDEITVPSNWEMEGFGHPKFRNIALTFESDPPNIPDYYNPTGCYKHQFTIPSGWGNKEIMLRFEGVKSASYVWINGQPVGYNQGGFEPAEYNITPFIKKGENDLSVEVLRYCDGSYLENQDMWRLSGIFRDVELYAVPKVYLHDFYFTTDLDEKYRNAELNIEMDLKNAMKDIVSGYSISVDVLDQQKQSILKTAVSKNDIQLAAGETQKIAMQTEVINPKKWSAEIPNLYDIVFELKDKNGKTLEAFSKKIGFREVEVDGEVIKINGVPVKFNGVNSHMHHPEHGQAVPVETLKKDLLLMKQFNINCVRTCHYPPSPEYVELADELGMYIFDEVGDEAHANEWLSSDARYTEMYKDRTRKLVYRDRNHASVVVWSAGNESGSGDNIKAVIETGKAIDPSRSAWMYGGNTFYIPFEDITGPRYWDPYRLKNLAERKVLGPNDLRPSFMDEYVAATGNGLGGLDEYWELIWKYPRLSGGAIWDWISPGIKTPLWITPDASKNKIDGAIFGRPTFVTGIHNRAISFTGHDDWVEFYRDPRLDVCGNQLTISFWVNPKEIPQPNTFVTKGTYQYGIIMNTPRSLEFYIHNQQRISAKATIPANWYDNWHHVAGIYNGQSLQLYIDQKLVAETACSVAISNTPYPLCIGRDADAHDQGELSGRLSCMAIDDLMIFDQAIGLAELQTETAKEKALVALDFESDKKEGSFFAVGLGGRTYGIVWPDRKIQPEIYQIKKSGQPIKVESVDLENGIVKITNRHQFKNLDEFDTNWEILKNGARIESGKLKVELPAQLSKEVKIPFSKFNINDGSEYILTVSFSMKNASQWAPAGYEVAWDQLEFPVAKSANNTISANNSAVNIQENDCSITLSGANFEYVIDKKTALFSKVIFNNTNYLEKGPEFNVWRASLANEMDPWGSGEFTKHNFTPGLGRSIDNQLRTLGLDKLVVQVDEISVKQQSGAAEIKIHAYSNSNNNATAFERIEKYRVSPDGTIELQQKIIPQSSMPEMLPKIGLQFQLAKSFNAIEWYGRGRFETYPDRKTGAKIGIYQSTDEEEYVPYIIPQDYGNHTDVRWLKVSNSEGKGLLIKSNQLLNFSFHKYDTDNLSRAYYTYQLKDAPFNTLNVDYEVTGVGETATMQLQKYRVMPGVKEYNLVIKPF